MEFREQIIVANGISENEILKSFAKLGKNTFGLRIMNSYQFAIFALEKAGFFYQNPPVSSAFEATFVYKYMKESNFFKNINYLDATKVLKSIDEYRLQIPKNETEEFGKLTFGEFEDKNQDLINIYHEYIKNLKNALSYDKIMAIRKAISDAKALDCDIITLNEFPLKPLEVELVKKISNNNFKTISLSNASKNFHIEKYVKSFGLKNEIEYILNEILENHIPLDQVLIVPFETTNYSKLITDYCDELNIPYTLGINYQMEKSTVGRLYSLLLDYIHHYYDKKYLLEIINDKSFDKSKFLCEIDFEEEKLESLNANLKRIDQVSLKTILEAAGDLRLSFDKNDNDKKIKDCFELFEEKLNRGEYEEHLYEKDIYIYNYVQKIAQIFNNGLILFLENFYYHNPYTVIADKSILSDLKTIFTVAINEHYQLSDIESFTLSLVGGSTKSSSGMLHITSITKAFSIYRPYVFFVGLSSNNFPGSPKEDNNMLDSDYELIGVNKMSEKKVNEEKNKFLNLVDYLNSNDVKIYLSYAYYNEQTLKSQNSSSVLFEIFKKENGDSLTLDYFQHTFDSGDEKFVNLESFQFPITNNTCLLNTYANITYKPNELDEKHMPIRLKKNIFNPKDYVNLCQKEESDLINKMKPISASALMDFVKCQYLFYLKNILGLKTSYNNNNELDGIPSNDLGTLIHYSLEHLDKSITNKAEFISSGLDLFNEYLILHQPLNYKGVKNQVEQVKIILGNAYDLKPLSESFVAEEDIYVKHMSGLMVHGLPDLVVKLSNNYYKVIDYKVKNKIDHKEDDTNTLLQVVLYAYLVESKYKVKVSEAAYYYLKQNYRVEIRDLEEKYEVLNQRLEELASCVNNDDFARNGDAKTDCSYCDFKNICGGRK